MNKFRHSGTLGDLIYSLPIVRAMGGGEYQVAINNIEDCVAKYSWGNPDWARVDPEHVGRFKESDYHKLKPLLERQPYVHATSMWHKGDPEPDVDLDHFRSTLFRTFEGNYVEGYYRAFNLPITPDIYSDTWLEADPVRVAPIIVYRSSRYTDPAAVDKWREIVKDADLAQHGTFVGLEHERQDFIHDIGIDVPLCPINGFLELANVIAGADLVVCNQSFIYSLAMGLGKPVVLETMKMKPLHMNECYFPRDNITYF